MPAQWAVGARISWYGEFGYENFFLIIGGYPKHAQKLMEVGGARGRCRSRLIARAVEEGSIPRRVHGRGHLHQRGPMVSPAFMERYYAPQLRYGLEPVLEVGCRPCGTATAMRPMLICCLTAGCRGCRASSRVWMVLDELVQRRTQEGNRLLIFGPLSVTTELPCCTPDQIRAKVRHAGCLPRPGRPGALHRQHHQPRRAPGEHPGYGGEVLGEVRGPRQENPTSAGAIWQGQMAVSREGREGISHPLSLQERESGPLPASGKGVGG